MAQVQLLIDRNAGAAVSVERTGAGGMVRGEGGSRDAPLRIDFVSNAADVKAGDRVVTSGLDSLFPRGFAVGTVEYANRRAGEWTIRVRPAVDFSRLDAVLVILARTAAPAPGGGGQ
jgi:rod shape-determining protein MreC